MKARKSFASQRSSRPKLWPAPARAALRRCRAALAALRANIRGLGEEKNAEVITGDAVRPPKAGAPVSLAFLDPPYGEGLAVPALAAPAEARWLAEGALVVVEMGAKERLEAPEGVDVVDERRYGAASVVLLRVGASGGLIQPSGTPVLTTAIA